MIHRRVVQNAPLGSSPMPACQASLLPDTRRQTAQPLVDVGCQDESGRAENPMAIRRMLARGPDHSTVPHCCGLPVFPWKHSRSFRRAMFVLVATVGASSATTGETFVVARVCGPGTETFMQGRLPYCRCTLQRLVVTKGKLTLDVDYEVFWDEAQRL
ncbi:hypothetical protein P171DRAFT_75190 [Karstenula rhodostoma CBS 690.94]|uniref:Uncharacterized protein n=1 Tax=Karstenula rhodostoma CBS 690.94 TaxID=1392251 RepID=A0A9P4PAV2_9PLEO|nr:hypothetical protein P171DRAFT_75190 [Karstenula rhodostoma CBS 690.94]